MRSIARVVCALACTLILPLAGCGGGGGGGGGGSSQPVSITMSNLVGYWSGAPATTGYNEISARYAPVLLHIRPGTEAEGVEWIAEFVNTRSGSPYGTAWLDGDTLVHSPGLSGVATDASYTIETLTRDRIDAIDTATGLPITLHRQNGCAAAGGIAEAPGQAIAAAFGPDDSLHVITSTGMLNEDTSTTHQFRPPGDCAFRTSGLGGRDVVVAEDGTLRFVRIVNGQFEYSEATWDGARWTETLREPIPDAGGTYIVRITNAPDGAPLVVAARGAETLAWVRGDTGWTAFDISVEGASARSPSQVTVFEGPINNVLIRTVLIQRGRTGDFVQFDGTTWTPWSLPPPEGENAIGLVHVDETGTIHGAWGTQVTGPDRPHATFGTWDPATETWTTRVVGLGLPFGLNVRDGQVEMAVAHAPNDERIGSIISFALDGSDAPAQRLVTPFTAAQPIAFYDSVFHWFPIARFSDRGEVYVSARRGGYRDAADERVAEVATIDVVFDVPDDAGVTIDIPRLDTTCTETCTVAMPWNEIVYVDARAEGGTVDLGSDPTIQAFFGTGLRYERFDDDTWAVLVWRTLDGVAVEAEPVITASTTEDRVTVAHVIPGDEADPVAGASALALDAWDDGRVLSVVSAEAFAIEQRDGTTGEPLARFDACTPLAALTAPSTALDDGALVTLTSSDDCADILGPAFAMYAVWLDDAMRITTVAEVPQTGIATVTPDGHYVALEEAYDPDEARQFVRMQVFDRESAYEVELDRIEARSTVHGVDGGVILRDSEGFDAYDLDGTLRWSLDAGFDGQAITPRAEAVHGDRLGLGWGSDPRLTVGGRTPTRDGAAVDRGLWILTVDVATGDIVDDVLVTRTSVESILAVTPLDAGAFLVSERVDGRARFDVVVEGEVLESSSYATGPAAPCPGGGCPARPVFTVRTGDGVWSLGAASQGTTAYDGVTVVSPAPRPHLVRWSR